MDGLAGPASVIAVIEISAKITALCFQYSVAVKDAKEDVERMGKKVGDISHVLMKIKLLLDRQDEARLSTTRGLVDSLDQCLQELEDLRTKLEPGKARRTMSRIGIRALKWPFTSKQVGKIVAALEGYERTFHLALQTDQIDLIFDIDQKLSLAKLPTAKGASFNSHAEEHNARCLPNTRTALLDDISHWARDKDSKPIFWLSGMAGTGKSTIARTAAQSFAGAGQLGASFFFKKGEGERGNASRFFCTIAMQLVACEPGMKSGIRKALDADPAISEAALEDQFRELILKPLSEIQQARWQVSTRIVVIDALDECEQEAHIKSIIQLLAQTKDTRPLSLRVLVTSRPELPIRLGFKEIDGTYRDVVLHEIPKSIIEHDIRLFFEHELREIQKKRSLPLDWPGTDQILVLVELAVPLFIYADTVCRYVDSKGGDPEEYLQKILQYRRSTFSQLERTYLPILDQLLAEQEEQDKKSWLHAFQELVGSIVVLESPLSIVSLAHLLQIPQKQIGRRLDSLHSVLSVPDNEEGPIRLLHLSFREFLVDHQRRGKSPFWVNEKDTHKELASRCIELMSDTQGLRQDMCNLKRPGTSRSTIDERTIAKSLPPQLQYACRYWVYHSEQSQQCISDGDSTHLFLQKHFLHWLEAMSLLGYISDSIASIDSLLRLSDDVGGVETSNFLVDAQRFILTNRSILDNAPLQIYSSSLIFAPSMSVIKTTFEGCVPQWIQRCPDVQSQWGAHIQTLEGHSSMVSSVAYSIDGKQLASASADWTVRLWDAMTGRPLLTLRGHQRWIRSVVFSPDSKQLASASDDSDVRLWDATTGQTLKTLRGHSRPATSVSFSQDGKQLASGSADNSIRLWDVATGQLLQLLHGHKDSVRSVVFSRDQKHLASASNDGGILLWDVATAQLSRTLEGHKKAAMSVAFSQDSKQLASGSEDNSIRLWDVATGQLLQSLHGHKDSVRSVAFSRDQKYLASGSDDWSIRLWDAVTWQPLQELKGHGYKVSSIAFSPDDRRLVSSSADGTVRLWDLTMRQLLHVVNEHRQFVGSMALSPDRKQLASASHDTTIRMWDVATGQSTQILHGHETLVDLVTFSPDGKRLASGSADCSIGLWDAVTGQSLQMLHGHSGKVTAIAFSSDGKQLVSASRDKTTQLWDAVTGKPVQTFKGHSQIVTCVTFSPDDEKIASASSDKTIRLWRKATGQLLQTLEGHGKTVTSIAFLLDGKQLASASDDDTVRLWDVATGRPLQTFEGYGNTVELEFAGDKTSLVTRKGILHLNGHHHNDTRSILQCTQHHVTLNNSWISIDGEDRIWLPDQHRGSCNVISKNRLIIGQRSGQIHFWEFDC